MTADPAIRAIAALDDDLRRRMFDYIRAAGHPVTRDEAAAAAGISRKLAAFHLDKLVDAGALRTGCQPAGGIRRVGRVPKLYEPAAADIQVSFPPRSHDVLADILLDALAGQGADRALAAVRRAGYHHGARLGAAHRQRVRPGRLGAERALTLTGDVLTDRGFEPVRESPTCLRLRNCPFRPLTAKSPALVCGLNRAFLAGLVDGLGAPPVDAVTDPRPGECCVALRARA